MYLILKNYLTGQYFKNEIKLKLFAAAYITKNCSLFLLIFEPNFNK